MNDDYTLCDEVAAEELADPKFRQLVEEAEARQQAWHDAHHATLAQLRKARGLTQQQLAAALGISQPEVSRIEHQTDLVLSTLRSYVEAAGGTLKLVAQFDDTPSVLIDIEDLTEMTNSRPSRRRRSASGSSR